MDLRLIFPLLLTLVGNPVAAQGFYRAYGHWSSYPWNSSAASPDAYYLAHVGSFSGYEGLELVKVNLTGDTLWSRAIPGGDSHMTCGAEAVYACNGSHLMKIDTAGSLVWSTLTSYPTLGNHNSRVHLVADGVLTIGQRDCNQQNGDEHYGITISKFDHDGGPIWGTTTTLPFWQTDPGLNALASAIAPNGDIVVAGNRLTADGYPQKLMLARFNSEGALLWIRNYVDPSGDPPFLVPSDLITTSDGLFALAGSDQHDEGAGHILKFNDLGDVIWARRFRADQWSIQCRSLIEDSEQRLTTAGSCRVWGGWAGLLTARWDLDGDLIDVVSIGDINSWYPLLDHGLTGGQDLVERPGQGYVIAANYPGRHTLITLDYDGVPYCPELANAFPLLLDTVTWSDLDFGTPPEPVSDATSSLDPVAVGPIPQALEDICPLVTSIPDHSSHIPDLRIGPVPANDVFTCEWVQKTAGVVRLELIDACGRVIGSKVSEGTRGAQRINWSVADLERGAYYLRMTTTGRSLAERVLLH